jgi:integrase/recombinase XerD
MASISTIKKDNKMIKTQRTNLKIFQDTDLLIWAEAFLIDRKAQNLSKGTLKFYQNKLKIFLDYCHGQLISDITEITPNNLRQFLLYSQETGHNPGGIHAAYRTIKTFLRWHESEVEDYKNPIYKIKSPKVPEKILDPVPIEDIFAIVNTCKSNKYSDSRDKAILLVLLDTGCRAMEFINLNIENVNLFTGEIIIRQGKGRKPRSVYIGNKSRKALRRYLKCRNDSNSAVWITNNSERFSYDGLRAVITRRSKQAGINPPSIHSFRRQFALSMHRAGVNIYVLQKLMGHADLSTLQRYLKLSQDDIAQAHRIGSPVDNNRL